MSDNPENQSSTRRKYTRKPAPQLPNANIAALEADILPLVQQRRQVNAEILRLTAVANNANSQLEAARANLAQLEGEINFTNQQIAQMKGVPYVPAALTLQFGGYNQNPGYPTLIPPSPTYNPVNWPTEVIPGAGSLPANNRGLHPDATGYVDENGEAVNTAQVSPKERRAWEAEVFRG